MTELNTLINIDEPIPLLNSNNLNNKDNNHNRCLSFIAIYFNRYIKKIKKGIISLILISIMVGIGILINTSKISTQVFGVEIYKWLYFFSLLIIGYICSKIMDFLIFTIFYEILYLIPYLNTTYIYYYTSSFEKNISYFIIDIIFSGNYKHITQTEQPPLIKNILTFLYFIFTGNIIINILLKILHHNKLFAAYQSKIDNVILYNEIIMRLSKQKNINEKININNKLKISLVTKMITAKDTPFTYIHHENIVEIISKKTMITAIDIIWQNVIDVYEQNNNDNNDNNNKYIPIDIFIDILNFEHDETIIKKIKFILDPDCDTYVKSIDFYDAMIRMYHDWINLSETSQSHDNISFAVRIIVNVIYFIILFIIFLNVFETNTSSIFVPFTTLIVSISFAISSVVSQYVQSLVYIAYMFPYDIGDKISCPDINNNASLTVKKINIMTTEFMESQSGKLIIVPNYIMANYTIYNFKKSFHVTFVETFTIAFDTQQQKINTLKKELHTYLLDRPHEWKPTFEMYYSDMDITFNKLIISFWINHQSSWNHGDIIWNSKTNLEHFLINMLHTLHITYEYPKQRISVN